MKSLLEVWSAMAIDVMDFRTCRYLELSGERCLSEVFDSESDSLLCRKHVGLAVSAIYGRKAREIAVEWDKYSEEGGAPT